MSKEALDDVLRRASSDAMFRSRLQTDFDAAIRPYDLTAEEKQRLNAGAGVQAIRSEAVPERQAASLAAEADVTQATEQELMQATQATESDVMQATQATKAEAFEIEP